MFYLIAGLFLAGRQADTTTESVEKIKASGLTDQEDHQDHPPPGRLSNSKNYL
jgi:hypothetical protein